MPKTKPSVWLSVASKPEKVETQPEKIDEPGLLFPSDPLLYIMNEIGIPHSLEIESEHWVSMPLLSTNTKLWKTDDKVSFSRLKVYIRHYIHKNQLFKNEHVFPDKLLQVLEEMERVTFSNFDKILESHLFTE